MIEILNWLLEIASSTVTNQLANFIMNSIESYFSYEYSRTDCHHDCQETYIGFVELTSWIYNYIETLIFHICNLSSHRLQNVRNKFTVYSTNVSIFINILTVMYTVSVQMS